MMSRLDTIRDRRQCAQCGRPFHSQRDDAITCSDRCRRARNRRLLRITPPLPQRPPGGIRLLHVDPPPVFVTRTPAGQGRKPSYDMLDVPAICAIARRWAPLCGANAQLALWWYGTNADLLRVAAAFGFPHEQGLLIDLVKRCKNGQPGFSTGYTTRKGSEQCWGFRRGSGIVRLDKGVRQVIDVDGDVADPVTLEMAFRSLAHSEKPHSVFAALLRLYGDVPRADVFARRRREGWICWGNGLLCESLPPMPADVQPMPELITGR